MAAAEGTDGRLVIGVELLRLGLNSWLPLRERVAFGPLERLAFLFGRMGEASREAFGDTVEDLVAGIGVVEERLKIGGVEVNDGGVSPEYLSGLPM